MTSALDLLMDSDSTVETTTLLESNGICTIDSKTRTIFVPSEIVVGAVQSDKNAERIKFSCPKIVGDNLDLSKFSIRINFENVSSVDPDISIKDQYICEDASVNEDNIIFSWVIGKNAARYMGTIRFIVCAVKTDSDSNISIEWNTTVAQIPVLEGIEVDQPSLDENNKDIINQLLAITKAASDEAVKNVNSAKEQAITDIQNVSQPDKTLTVEGGIADAKATGNAINSLREDLGGLNESIFTVKGKENLSWIIGAVNKADGISVSHTKRIRSILFQADGGIVDINGDYQIAVAVYSGNNLNTFEKYIDFSTLAYRFEKGKYYVIVIKANPEVDFSDSDINDVLTHISIRFWNGDTKIESVEKKNDDLKKSVELVKNVGLNSDVIFSIGGLNPSDGSINDNMERLYSNIIFARKGSSICLKSNNKLKFAVYKYSDKFGNTFVSANALSLDDYEFTEDTYARILIESGNQNDLEKLSFNIFQFDLKELNDRVKYTELTQWTDKGYISISAVGEYTKFVVTLTSEWSFMVLPVSEGDKFIISGFGGNNSKLYAFTDRFGKVLERTEKSSITQSLVIQAPENGYVIFNALRKNEHYAIKYNENNDDAIENRNLIVPPYMPDINKVITSVPNNKTSAMSYDEIVSAWDSLQKKYPNYISKTNLGKETSGSLDMYRYDFVPEIVSLEASVQDGINKIYTKNDYPIVIMGACIHGAERPCAKSLLNLMTLIANAKDYSILGWLRNNIHFVIIPLENPWGYKNDKRTNVNQVDLNRNFEPFWEKGENTTENQRYRGTAPLSEKETQYIDSVLKECADKAVCYYSFHTHGVFTAYNMMTNFSSPALYLLNEMQNIGMSVTKMITSSGWINHNLPEDSGYIGCMEMEYGAAMASYEAAKYKIPSACPEVMYRYYDGGTGEVYNTDLDCMNTEYMLYSVTNACAKFLYGN